MNFTLHVWRQKGPRDRGGCGAYPAKDVRPEMSFLELLDAVNDDLLAKGEAPFSFESDCREGICGSCSLVVDGVPHGPGRGAASCQLYLRSFTDGQDIYVEPFRAGAFPIVKDLVVDRSAFDRIIQAGGYVSVNTGNAPDGNATPVPKTEAEVAMDAAECIGCGACVAGCKNASAMLFTAAKVSHLRHLPQGHPERGRRVLAMVAAMDREGFGNCSNQYECEAVCPKEIGVRFIAELNREYTRALFTREEEAESGASA